MARLDEILVPGRRQQRMRIAGGRLFIADISSTASICRIGFILRKSVNTSVSIGLVLEHLGDFGTDPVEQAPLGLDPLDIDIERPGEFFFGNAALDRRTIM